MKFDKTMLQGMLAQDDETLWKNIVAIAASKGFQLPPKTPSPEEMQKLRGVLANPSKIDMIGAIKLLNHFKKGGK